MSELIDRLEEKIHEHDAAPQRGGLTPYRDPLRIPPVVRPEPGATTVVEQRHTWVRLHSQLPPTAMLAYDGSFPGPTIEVRRGEKARIAWTNAVDGEDDYPLTAVSAPARGRTEVPPSAEPGRGDLVPDPRVPALPAWTVTHLHGAVTNAGNDGWAENAVVRGDAQLSEYPNRHRATGLWYHDHAMSITRFNVYAGLVGQYLIRDDEEDALGLPSGAHEIPLTLADRNLDTDAQGRLTGRLLYKTVVVDPKNAETGQPVELPFTGPYTTVNGVIWPHLDVEARWYRFRLLNASNARFFDLVLVDEENRPVPHALVQIGSDGGLLPSPVPVDFDAATMESLTIAPAERMDLLLDFRALRGKRVRLVNRGGKGTGVPDPVGNVPFPEVMEFRVGTERTGDDFAPPEVLDNSFVTYTHDGFPHGHRMLLLTPPGTKGGGGEPELWELEMVDGEPPVQLPADGWVQVKGKDGTVTTYRRTARRFEDSLNFMLAHGDFEVWNFLNISGITHPMHIHLTDFQILGRDGYDASGFDPKAAGTRTPIAWTPAASGTIAPNEHGHKDVFQSRSGQMLAVMGQFTGGYGRFMYHCHLLMHEDMGMMRPFTVMPREAIPFGHDMGSMPMPM
ncbi:O-aminophenol oxidase PhsA [Mangrovactinospora gilvigrisea]|nr:O-aminophenol oxidase PhsA [Mangrovactinospora gilvigrisea]